MESTSLFAIAPTSGARMVLVTPKAANVDRTSNMLASVTPKVYASVEICTYQHRCREHAPVKKPSENGEVLLWCFLYRKDTHRKEVQDEEDREREQGIVQSCPRNVEHKLNRPAADPPKTPDARVAAF
jgi:hypothetical protein